MITTTIGKARSLFAELCNRVAYANEDVIVTRHGKPVLAMIPITNYQIIEKLERMIDTELAQEALADIEAHGTIDAAELLRRLDTK